MGRGRPTIEFVYRHRVAVYTTIIVVLAGMFLFFLLRPSPKPLDSSYASLPNGESVTVTNYHLIQKREPGGFSYSDFPYGAEYYIYVNLNDGDKLYVLCEVSENSLKVFEREPKQFEGKIVILSDEAEAHLKDEFDSLENINEENIRIAPFVITVK